MREHEHTLGPWRVARAQFGRFSAGKWQTESRHSECPRLDQLLKSTNMER